MGCDLDGPTYTHLLQVSIHAPAWGATNLSPFFGCLTPCFNPRTRMGCDEIPRRGKTPGNRSFNPRTRMGCDHKPLPRALHLNCFNPRTRMGCDTLALKSSVIGISFNPRTRMGCDVLQPTYLEPYRCFNPRTRMGCDIIGLWSTIVANIVSIHAPAWGATRRSARRRRLRKFQSTHPHGVRPYTQQ